MTIDRKRNGMSKNASSQNIIADAITSINKTKCIFKLEYNWLDSRRIFFSLAEIKCNVIYFACIDYLFSYLNSFIFVVIFMPFLRPNTSTQYADK